MRVMVFIAKAADNLGREPTLLALEPHPGTSIPRHLQNLEWTYYAEMDDQDVSLGGPEAKIGEQIEKRGFAEVPFRLDHASPA